jgi:hypothetical protein
LILAVEGGAVALDEGIKIDTRSQVTTLGRRPPHRPVEQVREPAEDELGGYESLELDDEIEELEVAVLPVQPDEFTCSSCFLVHHRSQLVDPGRLVCADCIA